MDKLSSSQRLDLNLEKGRMRDELQALRDKSNEMEIKMDRCVLALSARLLAMLRETTEIKARSEGLDKSSMLRIADAGLLCQGMQRFDMWQELKDL